MKWDWGQQISTRDDFKHVGVFEAPGPIYTLSFRNREWPSDWVRLAAMGGAVLIFTIVVWAMTDLSGPASRAGIPRYVFIPALIAGGIFTGAWLFHPKLVNRAIVMDFAYDRVLVFRRGRPTLDRKLSTLKNITITDHPDVELERGRRGPGKGPGPLEKQHCLMGWFGAGDTGTEQVILMTRYEFPKIHSLFEVAQAMVWVRKRVMSAAPSPSMKISPADDDTPPKAAPGIKPPLD